MFWWFLEAHKVGLDNMSGTWALGPHASPTCNMHSWKDVWISYSWPWLLQTDRQTVRIYIWRGWYGRYVVGIGWKKLANWCREIDEEMLNGTTAGICCYSLQVECIKLQQLRIRWVRVGASYGQTEADEEHRNCKHSHGHGRQQIREPANVRALLVRFP